MQSKYNTQWCEIETRTGKRGGIEILALNHERGRRVSVGTVRGAVYEKGNAAILRQPEPSFCLSKSELQAAKESGAKFFNPITPDKFTYSISIEDFERNAQTFFNAYYGAQLRTPTRYFQRVSATAPRTIARDNPATPKGDLISHHQTKQARQLALFGGVQ